MHTSCIVYRPSFREQKDTQLSVKCPLVTTANVLYGAAVPGYVALPAVFARLSRGFTRTGKSLCFATSCKVDKAKARAMQGPPPQQFRRRTLTPSPHWAFRKRRLGRHSPDCEWCVCVFVEIVAIPCFDWNDFVVASVCGAVAAAVEMDLLCAGGHCTVQVQYRHDRRRRIQSAVDWLLIR